MKTGPLYSEIINFSRAAADSGLLERSDALSVRSGDTLLMTDAGADLSRLSAKNIVHLPFNAPGETAALHAGIYSAFPSMNAVISASSPAILAAARSGRKIDPLVDDMAQIIGIDVRCAGSSSPSDVCRAMKRRNAVLVPRLGAVCADRTLDDAFAVLQILDKACRIQIETSFLGRASSINKLEAALQRLVYQKLYSKRAE